MVMALLCPQWEGCCLGSLKGLSPATSRRSGREAGRERKREIALVEWRRGGGCLESPPGGPASSSVLQILVKTMIRKRSFGNPFEGSRREERSLSAPGNLLT